MYSHSPLYRQRTQNKNILRTFEPQIVKNLRTVESRSLATVLIKKMRVSNSKIQEHNIRSL